MRIIQYTSSRDYDDNAMYCFRYVIGNQVYLNGLAKAYYHTRSSTIIGII
jgi:hypothetical protein